MATSDTHQALRTVKSLEGRVQNLPQELFDKIHDLVFAVPLSDTVLVDQSFIFPSQLHVDKAHRKQFGDAYFSGTTFEFAPDELLSWLLTIEAHKMTTVKIRYTAPEYPGIDFGRPGPFASKDLSFCLKEMR